MLVIHKEKEINRVAVGAYAERLFFHIESDRVFRYVDKG